jgi:methyl-accepting chemotaxis protein
MASITQKLAHSRLSPLILGVFSLSTLASGVLIFVMFMQISGQNAKLDLALNALSGQSHGLEHASDSHDALAALASQRNAIREAQVTFKTQVQEWKNTLLRGADSTKRDKYWKAFNEESEKVSAFIAPVRELPAAVEAVPVLAYFDSSHTAMQAKYTEAFHLFEASQGKDIASADKLVKGQDRGPAASLDSLVLIYGGAIQAYAEAEKRAFIHKRTVIIGISVGALLIVSALLFLLLHVLERYTLIPLREALTLLEAMAKGNLTVTATSLIHNEAGRLVQAASQAAASLRELLSGTTRRFQELSVSAEQLQGVSLSLDDGAAKTHDEVEAMRRKTEAVNQQVQSVAAATEEMGVCIQEIAQNAQAAANQSTTAAGEAEGVTGGLGEVADASAKIEDILQVIQRIAEQTHLLALNSSIEAARAGDAGKGFNVVAHEIKELSYSTSAATAQIQQRIVVLRQSVGGMTQSLAHLRGEVLSMRDRIGAIATAIEEQTNTTREIGRNVESTARASESIEQGSRNLESFARNSKDRSKEARSASEALKVLASEMNEAMSAFQI